MKVAISITKLTIKISQSQKEGKASEIKRIIEDKTRTCLPSSIKIDTSCPSAKPNRKFLQYRKIMIGSA